MKKVLYYILWIVLIALAMMCTCLLVGSLFGFESPGIHGLIAGAGIAVIYARRRIFSLFDKVFSKKDLKKEM